MAVLSSLVVRLATNSANFTSGIAKSSNRLKSFAKQVRNIQAQLAKGVITAGSIIAIDSIRNATEFGDKLQDLQAITGATGESLRVLSDGALEFGRTTTQGAEAALTAFKLVGSAKPELLSSSEALKAVTRQVILLSEASRLDLPTAVDATAVALNQFGASAAEAARFVNVLAAGSKFGASEVRDTALAIRESGTIAAQAGVSFEELNGLIQLLAEGGIKGSKAGTALRAALVNLESQGLAKIKPSTDGVVAAFQNLSDAQLTTAERAKLFGKEALSAANILVDGVDKIQSYTTAVTGTQTANEQAAVQSDSLVGDLKRLGAAYDALSTQIGQNFQPTQRGAVQSITDVVKAIDLLIDPTDNAVKRFGVFDFIIKGITKTIVGFVFRMRLLGKEVGDVGGKIGRTVAKLALRIDSLPEGIRSRIESNLQVSTEKIQTTRDELQDAYDQFVDGLTFGDEAVDGLAQYQLRLKEIEELLKVAGKTAKATKDSLSDVDGGIEVQDTDQINQQLQRAFDQIRKSSLSREQFIIESLERDKEAIARAVAAIPALAEEANTVIKSLELKAGQQLNKLSEKTKTETEKISTFAQEAARNMQSAFADFLFDPFEKGIKGMLRSFIDVIRRMVAEAASAQILQSIGFGSGGSSSGGSLFSSAIGSAVGSRIGGGAGAATASTVSKSFANSFSGTTEGKSGPAVIIQQTNDFRSADSSLVQRMPELLEQQKRATVAEVSDLLQRGLIPTG